MTIIAHLEAIIFLCKCITNQSSFSSINTKATFQPTRIVKNPSSPKTEKEPYGIPQRIPSNTFKEMNSFPRVPGAEGINYGGDKWRERRWRVTAENKVSFFLLDERGLDDVLERGGGMYTAPISTPSTPFVPSCDCDKSLRAERILILKLDKRVHVVTTL